MIDLLDGCWAKIQRANEAINQFNAEADAFVAQPGAYSVVREFKDNGLKYAFIVKGAPVPPVRLAVLAGDAIHHLRSSLDWLVSALVRQQGGVPSRDHTFPICTTVENFKQAIQRGAIDGVGVTAEDLIRAQQPYTSATPHDTIFFNMSELNRQDKHRLPLSVAATARIGDTIRIGGTVDGDPHGPTINNLSPPDSHQITEDGVEVFSIGLAHPYPTFNADAHIVVEVALEQFGLVRAYPVTLALTHMRDATVNAIHSFVGEFS